MAIPFATFDEYVVRFWSKVDRGEKCWVWTAKSSRHFGYGGFKFRGKIVRAHVFAWFLEKGTWPEKPLLHSCDNPKCVNPAHLREGTRAENIREARERGRLISRGEHNPSAKLTDERVRELRAATGTISAIARRFGVSRKTTRSIRSRETWRHVD